MKYLLSTMTALLMLTSHSLVASEQIPRDRTIEYIQVYKSTVFIHLDKQHKNTDNCTHKVAKDTVALALDTESKEIYSAILSARVSGTKIGFGVGGCQSWGPSGTVPKIYRVDL